MFYGLNDSKTYSLNDIAEKFKMTAERIRQIKSNSLIKLKRILDSNSILNNY